MAITPYLYYQDVALALTFLSKAFGFTKFGAQALGPDGKINHAAMRKVQKARPDEKGETAVELAHE